MPNYAWVTLATNDSYALGALVLAKSLKSLNTAYPCVVLVTDGVTPTMRTTLSEVFQTVQMVDLFDSKDEAHLSLIRRPELGITFTKIACWKLTQFEKCVFLDADTLVLRNSDSLFDRDELSAAPDVGWPDCFNSGVFVFKPSMETYNKITEFALTEGSFDGGDQGLLNSYFSNWKDVPANHLPFVFNCSISTVYSYLPAFKRFEKDINIIHFLGSLKPWQVNFDFERCEVGSLPAQYYHLRKYFGLWWKIFSETVHQSLTEDMGSENKSDSKSNENPPQQKKSLLQMLLEHESLQKYALNTDLTNIISSFLMSRNKDKSDNSNKSNQNVDVEGQAGLAGSFARARLGEARKPCIESWHEGNIDYLGIDSFSNILSKLEETLEKPGSSSSK